MKPGDDEIVLPLIREEVHVDAVPVKTGGVRVTKSVDRHQELIEQELRKGHVDVERIKLSRPVDGPQDPFREGNVLIIPVASEVPDVAGKHWEVTEEIRLTRREDAESVQHTVSLAREQAKVERLDAAGNVLPDQSTPLEPSGARVLGAPPIIPRPSQQSANSSRVLSRRKSILGKRQSPKP